MRTGHRQVTAGKRVLVILRDGTRFVDRFSHFNGKRLFFDTHGPVYAHDLRVMSIYKYRGPTIDIETAWWG